MTVDRGSDAELSEALTGMCARLDPVPPLLLSAASAALGWRDPDARLAALVHDSALAGEPVGVRGGPLRLLSFAAAGVTVDVEVTTGGPGGPAGGVRLVGQVTPLGGARLEVRHGAGAWTGEADPIGRFTTADLPAGPMRIRCVFPGAEGAVTTASFIA